MKKYLLAACLLSGLSACQSPVLLPPMDVPKMPQASDISNSFHQNSLEFALLSPDKQQIYYQLNQEAVVNFKKPANSRAYQTQSKGQIFDRSQNTRRDLGVELKFVPHNGFYSLNVAEWVAPDRLVMLTEQGSKKLLLAVNPQTGSQEVLYEIKNSYLGSIQRQGDFMYFVDQPADGIRRLNLKSGLLENYRKVPLGFYSGFAFQLLNQGHLVLSMTKPYDKNGSSPLEFRVTCAAPPSGGNLSTLSADFRVSCAIPPSSDTYLIKADGTQIQIKALQDTYTHQFEGSIQLSADEKYLSFFDQNKVKVVRLSDQQEIFEKQAKYSFWLNPQELLIVQDSEARIYDVLSGELGKQISLPFDPAQAVWNPEDQSLLISDSQQLGLIQTQELSYRELGKTQLGNYKLFKQPNLQPLVALQQVPGQPAKIYQTQQAQLQEILSLPVVNSPINYQPDGAGWQMTYVTP